MLILCVWNHKTFGDILTHKFESVEVFILLPCLSACYGHIHLVYSTLQVNKDQNAPQTTVFPAAKPKHSSIWKIIRFYFIFWFCYYNYFLILNKCFHDNF